MIDKKSKKAKRVEDLFVGITKQMILDNGIREVSVRKVADEAGYTVATIYNHFGNFDTLLAKTRDNIINDMAIYLADYSEKKTGLDSIKSFYENYITYCLENPNIYYFLFSHHLKDAEKYDGSEAMQKLTLVFTKSFEKVSEIKGIDVKDIFDIANTIMFSVHGMLTIYLSDNFALTKKQIFDGLDGIINVTLKGHKK